jgi:hypothetical protein
MGAIFKISVHQFEGCRRVEYGKHRDTCMQEYTFHTTDYREGNTIYIFASQGIVRVIF